MNNMVLIPIYLETSCFSQLTFCTMNGFSLLKGVALMGGGRLDIHSVHWKPKFQSVPLKVRKSGHKKHGNFW